MAFQKYLGLSDVNSYNRSSVRQHIEGEGSQIRDEVIPSILSDASDRHDLRVDQSLLQGSLYVFTLTIGQGCCQFRTKFQSGHGLVKTPNDMYIFDIQSDLMH